MCIHAAMLIKGFILITQIDPFWSLEGSILITQMKPFWSPTGLQYVSKRTCWTPKGSILITQLDPVWSTKGLQFASKRPSCVTQGFDFEPSNCSIIVMPGVHLCVQTAVFVNSGTPFLFPHKTHFVHPNLASALHPNRYVCPPPVPF